MITAKFLKDGDRIRAVSVYGHADYSDEGMDIVCASVSSSLQTIANGITEVLQVAAKVCVDENLIEINLPEGSMPSAYDFLEAFELQMSILSEDYPGTIQLSILEVQHYDPH